LRCANAWRAATVDGAHENARIFNNSPDFAPQLDVGNNL
jgi:hypothetical protein